MKKINNLIIILITIASYIMTIYFFINGNYIKVLTSLLILPVMLIPKIINKKINIDDNIELLYLLFIFVAYYLGTLVNLYDKISYYDTITHFISGIFEAYLALYILKNNNIKNKIVTVLFVLGFVSFISLGWEVFEYTSNIIFKTDPQKVKLTGINDTMKDLIVALVGGILLLLKKEKV